jgi:hypothetical protein
MDTVEIQGPEITGMVEIDRRLSELRRLRNMHTDESARLQMEIDQLFLSTIMPKIEQGDWFKLEGSETWIFQVDSVYRRSKGVTIQPSVLATIYEDEEDPNSRCVSIDTSPSSFSISRERLENRLKKSSRQEFLCETRRVYDEIVGLTRTDETDKNQLTLNL